MRAGRSRLFRTTRALGWLVPVVCSGGCAAAIESGPPIADPAALASRAAARGRSGAPTLIRFDWMYGDLRGDVYGEGVARFNPPDSLRLDLFTSGDVAMSVALVGHDLSTSGRIEDVEIPPLPFVFAMAGLFRPGESVPRAFEAGRDSVLVYAGETGETRYYFIRGGRLRRVEERGGRSVQRVNIEWGEEGEWPAKAEYRNLRERSRVRWQMREIEVLGESHSPEIYELPVTP